MPDESSGESGVFTKSPEDQQAELEWLHRRGAHESDREREARGIIERYRERIAVLGAAIEGWDVSIQTMRDAVDKANAEARAALRERLLRDGRTHTEIEEACAAIRGFPDEKTRDAYLATRRNLTDAHKETIALQDRIRNIAWPLPGTPEVSLPDDVSAAARTLMDQMDTEFSGLEAAFGSAISAHNEWRLHNRNTLWGNREIEDTGEAKERPPLSQKHYEERMKYLQRLAATLSADMAGLTDPSPRDVAAMMARLRALHEKMLEYENQKEAPHPSERQADFLGTLKQLREQLKSLAQESRRTAAVDTEPAVESEARVNAEWDALERTLMPSVGAYEEIRKQVAAGRLREEDLQEAKAFMDAMYERVVERISRLEGLSPSEIAELQERARVRAHREAAVPAGTVSEEDAAERERVRREAYDKSVRAIFDQAGLISAEADALERQGKLTLAARQQLLERLREYPAQLLELDDSFSEYATLSPDRRDLVNVMKELRDRLELYIDEPRETDDDNLPEITLEEDESAETQPTIKPVSVADARDAYRAVVARYASVQHTLSIDQRRGLRTHIAQLAELVRRAELAHSVSTALEHAPAVAHAALASVPPPVKRFEVKSIPDQVLPPTQAPRRGVFGMLGDAFKLK